MAISKEHHSLYLFQEAAKRVGLAGTRWAFLGNQRLRNAPRQCPDPAAWREWWGFELPDKPLPEDANHRLHGIGNWLPWFGAAECLTIDTNGKDNCLEHDLNLPLPVAYFGRYHVVTNFGTSEHVWPTQQQTFRTIHDLCKPGGLIAHAVPSVGCQKHGHWLYPLDWLKRVADAQFYETLCLTTRPVEHAGYSGPHHYAVMLVRKLTDDPFNVNGWRDPAPNTWSKAWKRLTTGSTLASASAQAS